MTADLTSYPIPADVTVVWMYNPVKQQLLWKALANVRDSLAACPRRLTLIFLEGTVSPTSVELLCAQAPWLEPKHTFRCRYGYRAAILETRS